MMFAFMPQSKAMMFTSIPGLKTRTSFKETSSTRLRKFGSSNSTPGFKIQKEQINEREKTKSQKKSANIVSKKQPSCLPRDKLRIQAAIRNYFFRNTYATCAITKTLQTQLYRTCGTTFATRTVVNHQGTKHDELGVHVSCLMFYLKYLSCRAFSRQSCDTPLVVSSIKPHLVGKLDLSEHGSVFPYALREGAGIQAVQRGHVVLFQPVPQALKAIPVGVVGRVRRDDQALDVNLRALPQGAGTKTSSRTARVGGGGKFSSSRTRALVPLFFVLAFFTYTPPKDFRETKYSSHDANVDKESY